MRSEIRRALFSPSMLLSCLVVIFCFLGYSVPSWTSTAGSPLDYRASALEQSLGGIFFGGVMLMLPVCGAIPFSLSQVDEIRSGFLTLRGARQSTLHYALSKAAASMLSGGIALTLPFLLHCCFWHLLALPYDPFTYPDQEIFFRNLYGQWSRIAYAWPMYLWIAFGMGLCGALWALVSLASTVWIPDKLVAIMLPMGVISFWSYGLFSHLLGIRLPSPSGLYNDGLSVERLFQSLGINTFLGIAAFGLYYLGLKRRLRHV